MNLRYIIAQRPGSGSWSGGQPLVVCKIELPVGGTQLGVVVVVVVVDTAAAAGRLVGFRRPVSGQSKRRKLNGQIVNLAAKIHLNGRPASGQIGGQASEVGRL